jgi:quercetin dioxygenase-like cupin family protein/ligand-binding sensor protein
MHQTTEWGHINWIHAQNPDNPKQSFSVGITHLLPGKSIQRHTHYGIDQFLYILDGSGRYIINGVEKRFRKGMFFYLEADTIHETINTGNTPVREFMVSHPVNYNSEIEIDRSILTNNNKGESLNFNNILYAAVEAIRTQLLETISLPFTIFDDMWSVVIQNSNFSNYCIDNCNPIEKNHSCDCMVQRDFDNLDLEEGAQFKCKYGLTIFHYPIMYDRKQFGTIRGGHVLLSNSPQSTIIGINSLIKQIVRSISSYCVFNTSRQMLEAKDKALREVLFNNEILEKSLYVVNDKVTNLRINHHFLFNTLNSLASMSLTGDRYDLYNAIIDLSKMFRYTMTVDLKFVSLSSEVEYLETYLNLQRLRYGKGLEVEYFIEDELQNISVPFNFLQPIVENAFTHGFSPSDNIKLIRINVERIKNTAKFSILNNGVPLNDITINRINRSLLNNTGHGLSLIYEKIKSAYVRDFKMEVVSNDKEETGVIVYIPIVYEEEYDD